MWKLLLRLVIRRVIVPTEVPIATDTKQATTNRTATENLAGIETQHTIGNTLCAASSHNSYKGAGCKEDQKHRDNIFVSHTLCHDLQLPVKIQCSVLQTGYQRSLQEMRLQWVRYKIPWEYPSHTQTRCQVQDIIREIHRLEARQFLFLFSSFPLSTIPEHV